MSVEDTVLVNLFNGRNMETDVTLEHLTVNGDIVAEFVNDIPFEDFKKRLCLTIADYFIPGDVEITEVRIHSREKNFTAHFHYSRMLQ